MGEADLESVRAASAKAQMPDDFRVSVTDHRAGEGGPRLAQVTAFAWQIPAYTSALGRALRLCLRRSST